MNINEELSIDEHDFKKLIKKNKIYVDKTEMIKRIRDLNGTYYFLSRPRRFGKSLLLSTLKELFEGNRELFEGFYVYDNWDWGKTYPVIHLDLNKPKAQSPEIFEESLNFYLDRVAKNFSIKLEAKYSNDKLSELIEEVQLLNKKNVVVLIDEYDKPILDNMDNKEIATDIQKSLKDFYGTLKSMSSSLEFVFITGISKFSKVSVFSELNNLKDLTLNEDYSTICGYTQEELEKYFKKFIGHYSDLKDRSYEETLCDVKKYYDGYSWDGKNFLYNPFSIMNFFDDNDFNNYWFESGTPNFLVKIFKEDFDVGEIYSPIIRSKSDFNTFDIENLKQIPLMFQAGYLTIGKKESIDKKIVYTLKIPNLEVEESLADNLFDNFYTKTENNFRSKRKEILTQLREGKCDLFVGYLKGEINKIHYQLKIRDWRYYQSIILFAIKALNFEVKGEVSTFSGRMDIAIEEDSRHFFSDNKGHVIIVEVKYTQQKNKNIETLASSGLNQIKEKRYWDRYEGNDIVIICLAIKEVKLKIGGSKVDMKCIIEKMDGL
ncbi:MAG: ATP-binding protein [Methanobrevibacter sp.]|jgi:hypothetical protein|nr:ATP-binding protein [Candidatus Methanovirga aequatorialis]